MATSSIERLDSKGRIVIPAGFRNFLRLKYGSQVLLSLDGENAQLTITPASEKQLTVMKIGISDKPGSLAKIAKALADAGVDLISTESHSMSRGKSAEWQVTCSSISEKNLATVKKAVLKSGATTFAAQKL